MRSWILWLAVFITPVHALEITPLEHTQRQSEEQKTVSQYRVVVSGLTRTQATTVPNHELRVNGQLVRYVWELEPQVSLETAVNYFYRQIDDAQTLYQCRGLECGSSHFWANEIFKNARLVGREQFQHYRVSLMRGEHKNTLYILYITQRGTRQVIVNLDVLTTTQPIEANIDIAQQVKLQLARSSGWLSGFVVTKSQFDAEASKPLIDALDALSPSERSRIHLIVQCYEHTQMERNQACSDVLAQQLKQTLKTENIAVVGQAALTASPNNNTKPALRFVFWPAR